MTRHALWIAILFVLTATASAANEPLEFRLASDTREGDFEIEAIHPSTGAPLFLSSEVALSSADLDTVRLDDGVMGRPSLGLVFSAAGAERFAKITGENVGSVLAVVHDGQVITAPMIRAPVSGGRAQIESGGQDLDGLLKALEDAGVTIGEAVRRPPPPTEEEIGARLRSECEDLLARLDARVAGGGYWIEADSVLLTTLLEMDSVLEMYGADPAFRLEVWRMAESMWPDAAPRGWDDRVNVLIGFDRGGGGRRGAGRGRDACRGIAVPDRDAAASSLDEGRLGFPWSRGRVPRGRAHRRCRAALSPRPCHPGS